LRAALATAIAAAALALVPAAASADVTYACTPPASAVAANCAIWHTTPVTLTWGWPAGFVPLVAADCATQTFTVDTAGTDVQCVVSHPPDPPQYATATVRLDQTPPTVTGMSPARPSDHDGWWNHPVAFAFAGTDATSGISACDTVNYAGPDGAAATVTGSCTDVAGNTTARPFPIKYDATPPAVAPGTADAKVGQISLSWTTSPDAVSSSVLRSPGIGGAPVSQVYSGSDRSFTDSGVTGGESYTYTINASDPAGNIATTTMVVKAKAAPQAAASEALPRLDWRGVRGADYYNVQLFRNGRKILSAWPHRSQLQLQKVWRYAGKRRTLSPGIYRWYAWPGYGPRSAHRYGKLIMTKRFKVKTPASGQAASRG
jgi:hypothetical protein